MSGTLTVDGLVGCELVDEPAKRLASAVYNGGWTDRQHEVPIQFVFRRYGEEEEDQMFGKAKGRSHETDEPLPPAPQLQDLTPANLAESDSTDISCIGPRMTVVGKISSEGTLNVFGRVEGELHASIVRISDGAEVDGTIAAQELTIGGRFKGTIQADRVMLTSSAVVEGEIHHRSLAIEENAWFAGASRPKENGNTSRAGASCGRVRPALKGAQGPSQKQQSAKQSVRPRDFGSGAASTWQMETSTEHSTYRPFCLPSSPSLPPSFPFLLASAVPLLSWTFDVVLHWPSWQRGLCGE
jgi:cytoskeletal protein CcmA (bactofilin family)